MAILGRYQASEAAATLVFHAADVQRETPSLWISLMPLTSGACMSSGGVPSENLPEVTNLGTPVVPGTPNL